jgi:hypothetical protein
MSGLCTRQQKIHGLIHDKGKNFLFSKLALLTTHIATDWVPEVLSPGVKTLGHNTYPSPPTSVKVKNNWNYTSTPNMPAQHVEEFLSFYLSFAAHIAGHKNAFINVLPSL